MVPFIWPFIIFLGLSDLFNYKTETYCRKNAGTGDVSVFPILKCWKLELNIRRLKVLVLGTLKG